MIAFICSFLASLSFFNFSVSVAANPVYYQITEKMRKQIDYRSFEAWTGIPWTTAYFDINQIDLKLVKFEITNDSSLPAIIYYQGDKVGVPRSDDIALPGGSTVDFANDLDNLTKILFNKNYVPSGVNAIRTNALSSDSSSLNIHYEIDIKKPLSFYISSFLFFVSVYTKDTLPIGGIYTFSFTDFNGDTIYHFQNVSTLQSNKEFYTFVTMPIQVPNLSRLEVDFRVSAVGSGGSLSYQIDFGQLNIFSKEDIVPVPPSSPFSSEYERVAWYNVFGHMRNVFRWAMFGVVGSVLPIEPLRKFLLNVDILLRNMFNDTFVIVFGPTNVSVLGTGVTLFVFWKGVKFIGA